MDPQTTQAVQSALTQLKAPEPEARIAALQQLWDLVEFRREHFLMSRCDRYLVLISF